MDYSLRFYRDWVTSAGLVGFEVRYRETDLAIKAQSDLSDRALKRVRALRSDIELYDGMHPGFIASMSPVTDDENAPEIVREMIAAGRAYGVGPMAAVAGAIAEAVGRDLLDESDEVIVENGGDVFLRMKRPVRMALYSGERSVFGGRLVLRLDAAGEARGVCTSSAHVGPSTSFGDTDAVVCVADTAALADAAATAIGNRVASPDDVAGVLEAEQRRGLLRGAVVIIGETFGAFGEIQLS